MNKIIAMLIAVLAMGFGPAFGQTIVVTDPTAESPFYGRLDLTHQASKDTEVQRSLSGKIIYGEYKLSEKFSVTFTGYHDQEFWSVYPGVAFQATDEVQLGFGGGRARYDGQNWTVMNPWMYYEKGEVKAFLYAEYTWKDKEEPWYFKGYLRKDLGEKFFAGIYGEKFLGIGPMLGMKLAPGIELWAMIPLIDKADMRMMAGLSIEF